MNPEKNKSYVLILKVPISRDGLCSFSKLERPISLKHRNHQSYYYGRYD